MNDFLVRRIARQPRSQATRVALGLGLAALVCGIRLALVPSVGLGAPFAAFVLAVLVACVFGGVTAAVTCVAALSVAGPLLLEPAGEAFRTRKGVLNLLFFLASSGFVIWTVTLLRSALSREVAAREGGRLLKLELHHQARYRLLAENTSDMITCATIDGRTLFLSPSVERITGYTVAELMPRQIREFVHPDDLAGFLSTYGDLISGRRPSGETMRYRVKHKDGHWLWLESNPRLVVSTIPGEPNNLIDVARDATEQEALKARLRDALAAAETLSAVKTESLANMSHEIQETQRSIREGERRLKLELDHRAKTIADRKRAQREARRFTKRLEHDVAARTVELSHANHELESFAYALAHDFRQPIRQIKVFATLIGGSLQGCDDPETLKRLAFLDTATSRLGNLVDVMTAYTLLNQAPPLARIDLNEVIGAVRETIQPYLDERGGVLIAEPAPWVWGNEILMRQVFQNLIVNGLKYNESPTPTVTLGISVERDVCVIRVADNGIGIEPAYLEEVFAPLKRLNNSSDFEGSGIGLAIVRRALKYQQGSVDCQSRFGEGSAFTVRAPLSPPAPSQPDTPAAARRRTKLARASLVNVE